MPSPKWKLVVDIGDVEETVPATPAVTSANLSSQLQHSQLSSHTDLKDAADFGLLSADPTGSVATAPSHSSIDGSKDARVEQVITLLGEYMPSDPNSPAANYLSGFMSLRLLLLRQSRSMEEEEFVRTILDSFSSYTAGGRERSEIAMMLARDYIFLSQQQQQQTSFLGFGQGLMSSSNAQAPNAGLSLFGQPSTSSSLQNSPALTPIPAPGIIDSLSIVSN